MAMAWRYSPMASSTLPLSCRAAPRLLWAPAYFGSRAMALRHSLIASSTLPLSCRAVPRLLWAPVLRVDVDGLAPFADGFVHLALVVQGEAEVVVALASLGSMSMALW